MFQGSIYVCSYPHQFPECRFFAANVVGWPKDKGKDKDTGGKRSGLYSAQKRSAPGFSKGLGLEVDRDTPSPPMSRRRKNSLDSSLPDSSRTSSPARSSSSEKGDEEPTLIKQEGDEVEEVVKTEVDDGLTMSSSDHKLPAANLVCNVALNKGRRRALSTGLQFLHDHDTALQASPLLPQQMFNHCWS